MFNDTLTVVFEGSSQKNMADARHPTLRLDAFLRTANPLYKGDIGTPGSGSFLRPMPMYGTNRPSPCFTSESRVRKFPGLSVDMTNLPPVWYDTCIGNKTEGCVSYPPLSEVDDSFFERFKLHGLMLPSERLEDHKIIKQKMAEWKQSRAQLFEYKKRRRILERKHRGGIVGIDYPLRPDTILYKHDHDQFMAQAEAKEFHDSRRREFLQDMTRTAECLTQPYGSAPAAERGSDELGIQRKGIYLSEHPFRFEDTYSRLWPQHVPSWDPARAKALRHHDVRHKRYDFLNFADNEIHNMVVRD